MKVTKGKIVEIANALEAIKSTNKVLTYAIIKNKKIIEPEVEALREALKTDSEGYTKYIGEIRDIANEYGEKDAEGNIVATQTGFKTAEGVEQDEVQTKINDVNEKYKGAIEERDNQIEEYNKMLTEEVDVDFYEISLEAIPEDVDSQIINVLFDIIKD